MPVLEMAPWIPQAIEVPPGLQYRQLMPHQVLGRHLPSPTESDGDLPELDDEENDPLVLDQRAHQQEGLPRRQGSQAMIRLHSNRFRL